MKYAPFPFSDLKKLHLVDPGAFLQSFRQTWVFLIAVICILMPVSNAVAQGWTSQTITSTTLKAVHFVNANTGWVVGHNGTVYKTIDGGTTWTAQTSGTIKNLNSVYCVSATTCWAVGQDGTILKTIDGGTTWTAQTPGTIVNLHGVYFVDANTGWAVGTNGSIRKTINGGTAWTAQTSGTTQILNSVYFVSATTGWAVGNNGTMLKTIDGDTWTAQTSGTTQVLNSVYCVSATTCWAVGQNGIIFKTIDGDTWTAQTSGAFTNLNSVYFVSATTGWAVGNNGTMIKTIDGGTTWTAQTSGTINNLNSVYFVSATTGWAVGNNGTIPTYAVPPAAPTNLVAYPCDGKANISFTAGSNGGSPITNYEYSLDGMSWTAFSPAVTGTTVTVTNLTNGTVYNIELRAVNAVGSGASATVTVTVNSAAIIYWGGTLMHTNSKSGVITLAARVVLPVGADATQSQLRFLNRDTNQPISGWLPVNLVVAHESHTGFASYQYSVTLGSAETERNITIGFELDDPNSCFTRDSVSDNVSIMVKEVNSCGCN